jgi:hypothetical protein
LPTASHAGPDQPAQDQDDLTAAEATTQRNTENIALQQDRPHSENLQKLAKRGHGRALPK